MNSQHRDIISGLYAITPSGWSIDQLLKATEAALEGGANLIQFRDKTTHHKQRKLAAEALVALCARFDKPLIINDDIELALHVGAAGVHLGQQDKSVKTARARLGDDAIIGATCHNSIELAMTARQQGASYLAFGRFFSSSTKPNAPPASINVLMEAQALELPVVAIGGITVQNAGQLLQQGADAIAISISLYGAEDIHTTAKEICQQFT